MAEYIVDTTDGIYNARMTGELVRCGECIHFERCPMRKGDGSGYCWQAKRRETVRHAKDEWDDSAARNFSTNTIGANDGMDSGNG